MSKKKYAFYIFVTLILVSLLIVTINSLLLHLEDRASVFQPQVDGTAKIYGMMTSGSGSYGIYEPYDYIKSQLGLTW